MEIVYAKEPIPADNQPGLFLAGPTPRSQTVESWRPQALDILGELGWTGRVFVPEDRDGTFHGSYLDQVEWEWNGLTAASTIMFWVPRNLDTLPGFTTNVEFGLWASSGKVVFGAPTEAPKVRYLQYVAERLNIPVADTLTETLRLAIAREQE